VVHTCEIGPIDEQIHVATAAIEPIGVAQNAVPHTFLLKQLEHPTDQHPGAEAIRSDNRWNDSLVLWVLTIDDRLIH
jgi:hypothetical protein